MDTVEWKRVYQGGHHDVWCDGKNHQHTDGGWVWADKPFAERDKWGKLSKCSCSYWGNSK